ncbi:hypothetical protein EWM64_g8984 [Hericium alpestre]|uniref:Uncharacterized protein n=1 Tax=Hericium alpestre TaxID=135208 RepID=A0A4Y9ZL98_9AGAM|nr:hypothetical protein EWM64_g8984 [Hericium alpestre]
MLKSLYNHFTVLYDDILPLQPSLASEHALRQEEEIHARTTKFTYRNAVISSIASIKTRPPPTSLDHPSVGTSGDLAARPATVTPSVPPSTPKLPSSAQTSPTTSPVSPTTPATPISTSFTNLLLQPAHLAPLLLDATELPLCGFVPAVDPTWGPGSEKPSAVGERQSCERCSTIYAVHSVNAGEGDEECLYHWGRPFSKMINGACPPVRADVI